MSDIRRGLELLNEPSRSLGFALIDFYESMKKLENDTQRGGKQATMIVMTISDIEQIFVKTDI